MTVNPYSINHPRIPEMDRVRELFWTQSKLRTESFLSLTTFVPLFSFSTLVFRRAFGIAKWLSVDCKTVYGSGGAFLEKI